MAGKGLKAPVRAVSDRTKYIVKQKYAVVNDAYADAVGNSASITELDTTDLVSMGKQIDDMQLIDGWFGALANRIVRTVYFVRTYGGGRQRSVLRDEHEYGAFIQKVYYKAPDFVANPEYGIPQAPVSPATEYTYNQSSPYDVSATVEVSASVFGGQGTLALEFVRPVDQIRSAFLSESEMIRFIDGIYVVAENKIKKAEEELTNMAVNTAMAYDINAGLVRNLLEEYNSFQAEGSKITAAQAMRDADFLRYAAMEIKMAIDYMGELSTVFNAEGYETFTDRSNMVVEMLSMFNTFSEIYLQSDTFHRELLELPRFEPVPRWQRLNDAPTQSFEDVSSISIKNSEINSGTAVKQTGIICFIHDIEHVAAYFGHRRTWEKYNERDDLYIHGDTMRKGYAVDGHANGLVFVVADPVTP